MIEGEAKALIEEALQLGASDIHIMPMNTDYQIYMRCQGQLVEWENQPIAWGKQLISYFKFLADMDVGEKRRPQSGAMSYTAMDEIVELRFSTMTNVKLLESLVIRVLRINLQEQESLNVLFPQAYEVLRGLMYRKSGLVLFSGPVGSGKTTTIYQLLRERYRQDAIQIITMEDPVEIHEEHFLQVEVNERADIGYDTIIKASLRHHPDILMIGEIRDEETARMAIRGALTGHLMIATIHAKNALGVLGRLQELQVTSEQLSQTLIGVTSQRLVPRYCPICRGRCQSSCDYLDLSQKRTAIIEWIAGDALQGFFAGDSVAPELSINHQLRKAWSYGFIDARTYHQFEII